MILVGLARMRHRVPKDTKRLLIEALVFPHVRYCISVWGSCTAEQRKRVQKAINFGARIVAGLGRREHVRPALQELGWGRVDDLIEEHDLSMVRRLLTATDASEILRRNSYIAPSNPVAVPEQQRVVSCSCHEFGLNSRGAVFLVGRPGPGIEH